MPTRPSAPSPKDTGKQVHNNAAPFSPQPQVFASNSGHQGKGQVNPYFNGDTCEKGTGDAKPVWP